MLGSEWRNNIQKEEAISVGLSMLRILCSILTIYTDSQPIAYGLAVVELNQGVHQAET